MKIFTSAPAVAVLIVVVSGCGGGATVGAGPGPIAVTSPGASSPPAGNSASPTPASSASAGASNAPSSTPTATATATAKATSTATATATATVTASPTASATANSGPPTSASKIKHIVIIIQENRTFDNIFHGFAEASGRKADYADFGYDKQGNQIALMPVPLNNPGDPGGGHHDFPTDYDNGKMDGFKDDVTANAGMYASAINYGYAYIDQAEVQPYFDIAAHGTLAERFFHGVTGPTWPSHLMWAAGSTTYNGDPNFRAIGNPSQTTGWGCEDPDLTATTGRLDNAGNEVAGPRACLSGVTTMADLLQQNNHTWHWYSGNIAPPGTGTSVPVAGGAATAGGNLNAFSAYSQIYFGPTWTANSIQPETRILTDANTGPLADVTYVVPEAYNSDHPQGGGNTGPEWVASVVNAIGESSNWNSTAMFVTWDDWGGWYDHVPPPQLDRFGLSFRIPLILVSPYARVGQINDTQYEPGSVLKFIEETFGLPSLGTTDVRANSVSDMFDFTQQPVAFTPIATRIPPKFFIHHPVDPRPVDPDH